jgi:hypothetical protein
MGLVPVSIYFERHENLTSQRRESVNAYTG